ncbi:thermonuclease family protein [Dolosicoccus paucivorans]|uniref:TNase-like domain-containing protein n=1 Tax=Dolosicoccus paucivorans TaxID=84521 RepID=A0A1G8KJ04_9LACT|nr:thermonuclease family protein [Dolosicoccus paucivorans]PMC58210.1 hypothetical protein CJ205_05310 [Dolosicoccus paucivorans]SDI43346.1 micrococcal nuclease [Dolosicoccus paucivorans]
MKKKMTRFILGMFLSTLLLPTFNAQSEVNSENLGYITLAQSSRDEEKIFTVLDWNVIDGDTADFILDRVQEPSIKARFLLIDTPELKDPNPYAQTAKQRVIELFNNADVIEVEYEGKEKDHYQRDLVHVWVDGILLQEILVTEGLAIARYIDGYINSQYVNAIYDSQDYAHSSGLGVWDGSQPNFVAKAEARTGQQIAPLAATPDTTTENQSNVYYKNCSEVRAAGAAPIYPGDPGWDPKFDRDNDGIGCE